MLEKTEWLLFLLAVILIAAVYYVGVQTDAATFASAIGYLGNVFTGRNPSTGQFANYPK